MFYVMPSYILCAFRAAILLQNACDYTIYVYIYIYIYMYMSISVQSSRRFFKSYFRTICFDILWSGVVFLWRSVHILWAEKEVQNHSHACRNTQTCQCLLVFWLCVWCKLKLTIYIYIYICFVRWYMLHILSAVQIEFAGSRVGGKKNNWSNSGK